MPARADETADSGRASAAKLILGALSPRRISAIYLWIVFIVIFGALQPDAFLSTTTVRLVLSAGAVTCVLALAFLITFAAGQFDLSVGALLAFSVAIGIWLQNNSDLPPVLGACVAVLACGLVGALSGFVVVKLHVNSLIATLGVSQLLLAGVMLITGNRQLIGEFPESWSNLGNGSLLGLPYVVIYLIVIALIVWYVLEFTRIGVYMFATGGNAEASRLSGVNTSVVIWGSLIASGLLCGIAGVIYSMRVGVIDSSVGPGFLFPALTGVFLGASQFSRRPNVWGTLVAYFCLAFGIQGLALSAQSAAVWSQPLFYGLALIIAVGVASAPRARRYVAERGEDADAAAEPARTPAVARPGAEVDR